MARKPEEYNGVYTMPKTYLPVLTKLLAEGQVDLSNQPPKMRSALGRTAQQTGLFIFKRLYLLEATTDLRIIHKNENYIKIQDLGVKTLETL